MTTAEILAMQPGPELDDALMEKKLLQAVKICRGLYFSWQVKPMIWSEVPSLSTNWEGMRLVVEAMAAKGWQFKLEGLPECAAARFVHPAWGLWPNWIEDKAAPHAVAIAALLALEGEHA